MPKSLPSLILTMLCDRCSELFSFSRPDVVTRCKEIKQEAIEYATENDFDGAKVAALREDLKRYEDELESMDKQGPSPKPWTHSYHFNDLFPAPMMLRVWDDEKHARTLQSIRSSADAGDCQLCITLSSMLQYLKYDPKSTPTHWHESDLFLERGSCVPVFIFFRVCPFIGDPNKLLRLMVTPEAGRP